MRFGVYDKLPPYAGQFAGRLRNHAAAHGHRLFGVRQWRQEDQRLADRPHPGPQRQDHLAPRRSANAKAATTRNWHGQAEPLLADTREQIIDPRTAYQIVSMLQGVVQRGTAAYSVARRSASRWPARPAPRSDARDIWFVGFSPDLAAGVYVGFDNPRTLGPRSRAPRWPRRSSATS